MINICLISYMINMIYSIYRWCSNVKRKKKKNKIFPRWAHLGKSKKVKVIKSQIEKLRTSLVLQESIS